MKIIFARLTILVISSVLALPASVDAAYKRTLEDVLINTLTSRSGQIELGVNGYYQSFFSYVDQDGDYLSTNVRQEGQLYFHGKTYLNEDWQVGFETHLEVTNHETDQISAVFAYALTPFGGYGIGAFPTAGYIFTDEIPSYGLGLNNPDILLFETKGAIPSSGYLILGANANKISFFTPQLYGFHFALSYTPNIKAPGGDRQNSGLGDTGSYRNIFSSSLNWEGNWDELVLGWSAAYETADLSNSDPSLDFKNYNAWSTSLNAVWQNLEVGAFYSHKDRNDSLLLYPNTISPALFRSTDYFGAGIGYHFGAVSASVEYAHTRLNLRRGGNNQRKHVELGGNWALSPGIAVIAAVQYMREDNTAPFQDTDGYGFALGSRLFF